MHVVRRVVFSHGRGRTQKHFNGITSKHIINQGIRRCFQPTNNYRFTTAVTTYSRERELDTFSQESLYPTAVRPTLDISSYIQTHKEIEDGSRHKDTPSTVLCGRITSFRESSKNLYFYTISDGLSSVQVLADKRHYASPAQFNKLAMQTNENIDSRLFEFQTLHGIIQRGDLIAVDGFPGKTKRGELSIVARQVRLLAPCLMDIPAGRGDGKYALKDKHTRYQNRYLDLLANRDNLKLFRMRSEILDEVRTFFRSRGFMSVETPVLCKSAGGATARPFKTVLNAEQRNLELRIAPELYLKKLVVGGFEKVYEMGTVFRNEGLDHTHNPEFTMCEAYQAHADYTDMMDLTEQLLRHVSQTVCGSTKVQVAECTIDFSQPFQRIPIISGLEQELGMEPGTFPKLDDDDESQLRELRNLCVKHAGVSESDAAKMNGAKLCDGLIAAILEPKCIQPTFLMDHPVAMSPLAKRHRSDSSLTERFELFVLGRELCNSYSELNEPREQKLRFEHQRQVRLRSGSNDHDADAITSEFCDALEYGLPPTAGWGMGIDRLVMLLTGQSSIRDVILFPVV